MPLHLIDTHAHLDDEQFSAELPAVLERATAAGVVQVVSVGTNVRSSTATVELAHRYPSVFAAVGLHPCEEHTATETEHLETLASERKVVAIGEIGMDGYRARAPMDVQATLLESQLRLARARGLPVIIHCRQADEELLRVLRAECDRAGAIRGVMHSFTGNWMMAKACLTMGLHISFAGMLTFKNSQPLRDTAAQVPVDRLLVETDSPYLAPVPMRGKRNEPANVVHTAAMLATLKGVELAVLAEQTTANARELFHLPAPA